MPAYTPEAEKRRAPRDQGTFGDGPFESVEDFTLYDRCITRGIVGSVLALTLARPGLHFTGMSTNSADMTVKHLELLKSVVPGLSRYAVLVNPTAVHHPPQLASHHRAKGRNAFMLMMSS